MLKLFFRLRYVASILLFVASFWGYRLVRVELSPHEKYRRQLADQLAEVVSRRVSELGGPEKKLMVAALANDEDGVLREQLRSWIARQGMSVKQPSLVERAKARMIAEEPMKTEEQARQAARSDGVTRVLFGAVRQLITDPEKLFLEAELRVWDVDAGRVVFDQVTHVPADSPTENRPNGFSSSLSLKGLGVWLLIVVLLPLVSTKAIALTLRQRSNGRNAAMLVTFAFVAGVSGWLLWASTLAGALGWLLMPVGILASSVYFGYFCGQVEQADLF